MQTIIVFLAVAALASASPFEVRVSSDVVLVRDQASVRNIVEDFRDFGEHVDTPGIIVAVFDALSDTDVQHFLAFIFSPGFSDLLDSILAIPEASNTLIPSLEATGVPVSSWIKRVRDFLGHDTYTSIKGSRVLVNRNGVAGLFEEVEKAINYEETQKLHQSKIETSADFRNFLSTINSNEFRTALAAFQANPAFVAAETELAGYGVEKNTAVRLGLKYLGFPGQ